MNENLAFQDLINFKDFGDGYIIDESDTPIICFKLNGGINTLTAAEAQLDQATLSFRNALNTLKAGEEVQIVIQTEKYDPEPDIFKYNERIIKNHPVPEFQNYYPNILDQFITDFVRSERICEQNIYILFTYRKQTNLFTKTIKSTEIKKDTATLRRNISNRSRGFVGFMGQISGVEVVEMTEQQIKDMLDKAFNPEQTGKIPVDHLRQSFNTLKSSLIRTPFSEENAMGMIGEQHVKTFYIADIPSQPNFLQELFLINNYSTLSLFVRGISQHEIKEQLTNKLKLALGTSEKQTDIDNRAIADNTEILLSAQARREIKFIEFACYLSFRHENRDAFEELIPEFESIIEGCTHYPGIFEQKKLFLSTLPLCHNTAGHYYLTITGSPGDRTDGNLSYLMPAFNFEVKKVDAGVYIGTSLTGKSVFYGPYNPAVENNNHIIVGRPGSGKSFFINLILTRIAPWRPEVIIIDKSKSYEYNCKCNDGQYITLSLDGTCSYNPFDCIDYDPALINEHGDENDITVKGDPTPNKIAYITGLFDIILSEEGVSRLSKVESGLAEKMVRKMYKNKLKFIIDKTGNKIIDRKTIPLLRDILVVIDEFIETIESQKHKEQLLDIKEKFSPFIGEGSFAGMLDRPSNIELKSSFVVFDISGLPANRDDILSLGIYIISNFSMQRFKINKKLQKRQLLVIDEAWFLARFSGGQNFLLDLGKRSRHLGLASIIATQQLSDFLCNEEAKKVLTSAPTKTLFHQSSEDLPLIKELYRLNENEMGIITTLKQVKGLYSEAFYMCGNEKNLVQVRADRVAYWIATSDTNKDIPIRENEYKITQDYWKTVINLAERGV
jgi:hypothetical protein